jgi:glycosyltransferase involved in cell wall biosynthesis
MQTRLEQALEAGDQAQPVKGGSVSVALCTYNGAQYLKEQLDSIASQTVPPIELVVCDDRSTDDTVEILKGFASRAPFPVRLFLNERNLGSTKNFERAIGLCEGDLIALSDQDDAWHPEKLERVGEVFAMSPGVGAVFTDAEMVDDSLRPLGHRLWDAAAFGWAQQRLVTRRRAVEVLLKYNVVTGATMAFRSRFRDVVLPIPSTWVHDAWIALLIAAVADLAIIRDPLIRYRQHAGQQIGAIKKRERSWFTLLRTSLEDVLSDPQAYVARWDLEFLAYADQYQMAYERLSGMLPTPSHPALARCLAKAAHFRARSEMSQRRWMRFPMVVKELFGLRYHRYSSGNKSLAKDLIRAALFWTGSTRRAGRAGMP